VIAISANIQLNSYYISEETMDEVYLFCFSINRKYMIQNINFSVNQENGAIFYSFGSVSFLVFKGIEVVGNLFTGSNITCLGDQDIKEDINFNSYYYINDPDPECLHELGSGSFNHLTPYVYNRVRKDRSILINHDNSLFIRLNTFKFLPASISSNNLDFTKISFSININIEI
jgi:hypothetical protein